MHQADGELLLAESVQRIVREWSTMVTVVNSHSTELRRMRVLLTEILQHSKDIPSLFVLLPANKTVVSKLKNPFKAIFNHEMRLFPVCPVTLKAVPCAIDEKGWEVYTHCKHTLVYALIPRCDDRFQNRASLSSSLARLCCVVYECYSSVYCLGVLLGYLFPTLLCRKISPGRTGEYCVRCQNS